ncbi:hypothetical protein V6N11_051369 [Hibiscus sabdariffa]|uniref:RING-type domain-containing protein n=2 Tax=Hibiscus sabdariffa TaxID=183260 RepID=A0ABR2FWK5_9ROSI
MLTTSKVDPFCIVRACEGFLPLLLRKWVSQVFHLHQKECYVSSCYIEEFRSRTPAIRFDAVCSRKRSDHKCPVCLTRFKPESEVNHLTCGHLFHKVCLEEWLNYQKVTCPSCRTPLLHEQEASGFW